MSHGAHPDADPGVLDVQDLPGEGDAVGLVAVRLLVAVGEVDVAV